MFSISHKILVMLFKLNSQNLKKQNNKKIENKIKNHNLKIKEN